MTTANQVLQAKGNELYEVGPGIPVIDALAIMADKNIGALVVVEAGELVGILSERDYVRRVALLRKSPTETLVREVMTSRVFCASPEMTVVECMALMTSKRVRHLPVKAQGALAGMLSIGDLVKTLIANQVETIENLESYIRG